MKFFKLVWKDGKEEYVKAKEPDAAFKKCVPNYQNSNPKNSEFLITALNQLESIIEITEIEYNKGRAESL